MATKRNNTGKNLITVFLGCSDLFNYENHSEREEAKALKKIVSSIHDTYHDVKIKPWWEYPTGEEYVLERVADNIFSSDFCIFVLAKDVETTELNEKNKKKKNKWFVPNSNVLIEMGIAVSKGKRILLLNWDPGQIKIPSDYSGKFYTPVLRKGRSINLKKVSESFKEVLEKYIDDRKKNTILTKYQNINIYYNKNLANDLSNPTPPSKWGTKALFIGSKSSACWTDIEEDKEYPETSIIKNFLQQEKGIVWDDDKRIENIKDIIIDNIVSFGPGAGTIDDDLVRYFRRDKYQPFYIPIDISIPLVTRAINNVTNGASFPIPFAIVDDFEEGPCFDRLKQLVDSKEYEIHKRNLFSIVGVTFSNYSKAEHYFLDGILDIMNPNEDYLLLDVVADELNENELIETVNKQINGLYKDLIIHSIRKRFPEIPRKTAESNLMKNVKIDVLHGNKHSILTNVANTKIVECSYKYGRKNSSLIIIKHYNYISFKEYLKESFIIEASSFDVENMRGLFLLSKRSN